LAFLSWNGSYICLLFDIFIDTLSLNIELRFILDISHLIGWLFMLNWDFMLTSSFVFYWFSGLVYHSDMAFFYLRYVCLISNRLPKDGRLVLYRMHMYFVVIIIFVINKYIFSLLIIIITDRIFDYSIFHSVLIALSWKHFKLNVAAVGCSLSLFLCPNIGSIMELNFLAMHLHLLAVHLNLLSRSLVPVFSIFVVVNFYVFVIKWVYRLRRWIKVDPIFLAVSYLPSYFFIHNSISWKYFYKVQILNKPYHIQVFINLLLT